MVSSEIGTPDFLTGAERTEDGYRLTGRKNFATDTEIATHCSFGVAPAPESGRDQPAP